MPFLITCVVVLSLIVIFFAIVFLNSIWKDYTYRIYNKGYQAGYNKQKSEAQKKLTEQAEEQRIKTFIEAIKNI